jgi:N-acetylglucosamine kinase-like BadF-type ATPase
VGVSAPWLLAIDGGNSKTDVVVVGEDGCMIAMVRGGGYRPHEIGEQAALDVVADAVAAALDLAGAASGTILAHVAASMANADLPTEEERLTKALHACGWSRTAGVGNDTFALLRAGASAGWGIAVVCGAGTNCAGVAPDGRVARFPALGTITGDWGGGAHLGKLALWHAIRGEDGRGPRTALTTAVAAYFGVDHAIDVGLGLHTEKIDRARLLELTPVLFEVAASGDATAAHVIDRQAEEVAVLGTVTLRRLDLLDTPTEVVLGGGVLTARHPQLMTAIEQRYAEQAPQAELIVVDAPPVLGAALLGLDHLGAPPESYANLRATLPGTV